MNDLDRHLPAIAAGDARAFAAWMRDAEPPLRASLRRFAAVVDTEAVLQETLLRVWQVAPRFEPDGRADSLLRLSHRIARNLAISETRRRSPVAVDPTLMAEGIDAETQVRAAPPDPHLRARIAECRDKLPPKPAMALGARLGVAGTAPDATLAERLGMTKNTFLQNFSRARKLLAACLRRVGVDLEGERA